jgi:hypothetical protein
MLPKRTTLALACEVACVAALGVALLGLAAGAELLPKAALAVAVPAYALCIWLSYYRDRQPLLSGMPGDRRVRL